MSMRSDPAEHALNDPAEHARRGRLIAPTADLSAREITLAQAIREALAEEMRRDPSVFIIGEDVAEAGTPFKVLSGLVEEFGPARVIDSPTSRSGITWL